jgi:hypothetical protein
MSDMHQSADTNRVLVKLRPSAALRAAESRGGLRPLHGRLSAGFELGAEPDWFLADLPGGAASPWDLAHDRVADQLGVSGSDVLFVEPDLVHDIFPTDDEHPDGVFEIGAGCAKEQGDAPRSRARSRPVVGRSAPTASLGTSKTTSRSSAGLGQG